MERVEELESVLRALEKELRLVGWNMQREVRIVGLRADAMAISPTRRAYFIELRGGNGQEHFASIAEVSRLRRALFVVSGSGTASIAAAATSIVPLGFLATGAAISAVVAAMARRHSVELLPIHQEEPIESARHIVACLVEIETGTRKDEDILLTEAIQGKAIDEETEAEQ